jgi:hypothetical protein
MLEVDELHKDNHLQVNVANDSAVVLKTGLYRFDAQPADVEVIKGKAEVQGEDSHVIAKGHHQVLLGAQLASTKYHDETNDGLAHWSRLRAEYESEASISSAQYVSDMGWGWGFSDWFWNPWFSTWAWLPGGPYVMNPYGFYFCNPGMVYNYFPYRAYGNYAGGFHNPGYYGARRSLGAVHRAFTPGRSAGTPVRVAPAPSMRGFGGFRSSGTFGGGHLGGGFGGGHLGGGFGGRR